MLLGAIPKFPAPAPYMQSSMQAVIGAKEPVPNANNSALDLATSRNKTEWLYFYIVFNYIVS